MGISGIVRGQCTFSTRRYATVQQANYVALVGSVTNPANAANGVPADFSVLNSLLNLGPISVSQALQFSSQISAGTPVTIKLGIPAAIISIAGGFTIQPFTGTAASPTAVGNAITTTSLVGLLNGAGDTEVTFTPQSSSGNVAYNGVLISLAGVAVGQSLKVYDAYVMQSSPTQSDCGTAVDVLSGVRAGGISLVNATGSVTTPTNAIDNDLTTAATLNVGLQVLSEVYLTTIFNTPSQPGDVVRILMSNPQGNSLASLGLLSNFTIQLYNGSTAVGSPISSSSSLLSLSLLTPPVSNTVYLDIKSLPTDPPFDRVDIQLGGVAGLGTSLLVYDVKRLPAAPVVTMNSITTSSQTVCQGSSSALAVSNPQTNCTTYTWYNVATGGTALTTGTSYTPPAGGLSTGANTYYVQANRTGCTEVSDRIPVVINVNPAPTFTSSSTPRACRGTITANMPYTATNAPTTYSIVWDATALAAGFVNVTDAALPAGAITVAVPAGAAASTYNGTLTVKNGTTTCGSAAVPFSVIVDGKPTQPIVTVAN
jgi:hypothetical protein